MIFSIENNVIERRSQPSDTGGGYRTQVKLNCINESQIKQLISVLELSYLNTVYLTGP